MLIHLPYAIGIIAIVSLAVGFAVSATIQAKPSQPSPIEQQCLDEGIDLARKCEYPYR